MSGKTISQLTIGDRAEARRAFTAEDVLAFAQLTGDKNPAHLDEAYASTTMFKTRIAHGMLVAGLFSALLGMELPGLGTIYTGQTLKFTKPVYLNETITASITVKDINVERGRVVFDCLAVNDKGETVIVGEATVMPPWDQKKEDA